MAKSKQYIPENYSYGMNHEYVDLGLSVKWATCNLGAYLPEEPGDYFAFGETAPGQHFDSELYTPPCMEIAGSVRDMARANWGEPWRLPSKEEFQELIDRCEWRCINKEPCSGYIVTSKVNGNSIFLPAAGYKWWAPFDGCESAEDFTPQLENFGSAGNYWSSAANGCHACALIFEAAEVCLSETGGDSGFSVRPVKDSV